MPRCDSCSAHVDPRWYRVFQGNDGELHGCPECTSLATRARDAAGVDSSYRTRTDPGGQTIPSTGGEQR
ncbi:DUF7563 family protein [Haloarcula sediminis]